MKFTTPKPSLCLCLVLAVLVAFCGSCAHQDDPSGASYSNQIDTSGTDGTELEFKGSWSAMAVCACRAVLSAEKDQAVRNPDYLARHFVPKDFLGSMFGSEDLDGALAALKQRSPSGCFYVNARTLHIDTLFKKAVSKGVTQVVVLGAGYDSRAYRFQEAYPHVKFFEVDLPDTQKKKRKLIRHILGKSPDYVAFAPIDFNTQTLEEVMSQAGFDEKEKTFYIWEGVTYFITEQGVNNTLTFIADHSASGSELVFDYMFKSVVEGDFSRFPFARGLFKMMSFHDQHYIFGIDPTRAEAFVNERGLAVVSDIGRNEMMKRYLTQSDGTVIGKPPGFFNIIHAKVP